MMTLTHDFELDSVGCAAAFSVDGGTAVATRLLTRHATNDQTLSDDQYSR